MPQSGHYQPAEPTGKPPNGYQPTLIAISMVVFGCIGLSGVGDVSWLFMRLLLTMVWLGSVGIGALLLVSQVSSWRQSRSATGLEPFGSHSADHGSSEQTRERWNGHVSPRLAIGLILVGGIGLFEGRYLPWRLVGQLLTTVSLGAIGLGAWTFISRALSSVQIRRMGRLERMLMGAVMGGFAAFFCTAVYLDSGPSSGSTAEDSMAKSYFLLFAFPFIFFPSGIVGALVMLSIGREHDD